MPVPNEWPAPVTVDDDMDTWGRFFIVDLYRFGYNFDSEDDYSEEELEAQRNLDYMTAKRLEAAYNFVGAVPTEHLVERSLKVLLEDALKHVDMVQNHAHNWAIFLDEETLDEDNRDQWQKRADDAEAFAAELKLLLGLGS